jgi:hypothetical protein
MTTPSELTALAERVEAARGIDVSLHLAIAIAAGVVDARTTFSPRGGFGHVDRGQWAVSRVPYYSTSLDAAMTLVPERWKLRQANFSAPCADDRKWHLNLHGGSVGQDTFVGRGATPALALTAAALRFRASLTR